ncbi:NAD(P)/FAD-dependent oxidoreductase [Leptothoe sp. PORK10 BA2]|uniref:NAD(P)/FAD-dependent oxidoreductase n=1 Tax=Leptothoe sp. PORK10 BA2 TaxID=3110254 RepID=UPI002B219227|nr:NAD(P)/FAD-dependent oxidoreductase [Leptothoe sp. PORK10 BA2]MEA5462391.1 NAD(P)/FAD-dependent oxidoreductase [Leptothoe sp. PORK10 BA2]
MSQPRTDFSYDVVIVGAGAAGIGCGAVLKELGLEHFTILERHQVGASFSRWPKEMSFITPSFPSHGFGLLDLNAVTLKTSPAIAFRREHIDGKQYALYLQTVANHFTLPIQTKVDVKVVEPLSQGGFKLHTTAGDIRTQFVIWAAGEYQYPHLNPFPGAQHCIHNSQIRSWADLEGDEFIIIGGYESGMDAAANLVAMGKKVSVLDRSGAWADPDTDPSVSLSPYTLQRLEFVYRTGRLNMVSDASIEAVKPTPSGYAVYSEYQKWVTVHPPILCTGFDTSLKQIAPLLNWSKGYAALTENDESTLTPGLFVSGPSVRHGDLIFCFIYKFRQRFAVIANAIANRLQIDPAPLEQYRQARLFLDDLSCCSNDCIC